ncbi:MAG: hypothetical protein QOK00_1095 [Thermoleophilaceae bacterium]|nr:hypothetical protein [Thermoleophilaceae bacterium]MEA2400692.1 hypothetical protein [Thermoleophilaceae bacterium]
MGSFNARDPEKISAHFAEDAEFIMASGSSPDGRIVKGRDQIRDVLAKRFERIPDMHWETVYDYVVGNRGVSVWHVTGHADDGTVLNYRGCDLWEFEDGLIVHKDTYWKIVKQ